MCKRDTDNGAGIIPLSNVAMSGGCCLLPLNSVKLSSLCRNCRAESRRTSSSIDPFLSPLLPRNLFESPPSPQCLQCSLIGPHSDSTGRCGLEQADSQSTVQASDSFFLQDHLDCLKYSLIFGNVRMDIPRPRRALYLESFADEIKWEYPRLRDYACQHPSGSIS